MSNNLNYYRQQQRASLEAIVAARTQSVGGSGRTQQPQPRFTGTFQNSGSQQIQLNPSHRTQFQSQPQLVRTPPQPHSYQATGSSLPNDNIGGVLGNFLDQLSVQISVQQRLINESLAKSDKCLEAVVSSVSSIRETADGLTKKLEAHDQVLEKLERISCDEKIKAKEINVMKILVGEIKAFKKTLGKSCDGDDGRTVLGRLDAITFAVGELLERARDPEANLSKPSTLATIIDLTRSSSPSPSQSLNHANVGTSSVPSPLPSKEKSFSSIQGPSSDPFGSSPAESLTPDPPQFYSAHTLVTDTTSADLCSTTLTRENPELAPPIPMDIDTVDPTEPRLDSQNCALPTISTNNSEDATRTQTNSHLSDSGSATTTTKMPCAETIRTPVHLARPRELVPPTDTQTPQNIAGLPAHKNDRPVDIHDARPLIATPVPKSDVAFIQSYTLASALSDATASTSTSTASASSTPTSFAQTEVQRPANKVVATLRTSVARFENPELLNSGVSEGMQLQRERSQKQGFPERLESPLSTREETPLSLDTMDPGRLTGTLDGRDHSEKKTRATKGGLDQEMGREEIKKIDLVQHLRGRPRSSPSRFALPSTPLSSAGRGGASSRLSIDPSEDITISSRLSSDTKLYSLTKTKVLVGVGASRSPRSVVHAAAAGLTIPTAASPVAASATTSNSTIIPVTTPIEKVASVFSSQSTLQPTTPNSTALTIRPVTPVTIILSPATSTKKTTPAPSESSHLELAVTSTVFTKPRPPPQSTLPAVTSSIPEIATITPTRNPTPALSRLDPLASPAVEPLPPSQASTNVTQDEASVSRMVIRKDDENDDTEGENLVERTGKVELKVADGNFEKEAEGQENPLAGKTTGKNDSKIVKHNFEKKGEVEEEEEEEEENHSAQKTTEKIDLKIVKRNFEKKEEGEEKQGDHLPSSSPPSLSLSPSFSPSIPGSPHLCLPSVSVPSPQLSVPSTPRRRSGLYFALLPHSPLAAVPTTISKNQSKPLEATDVFSPSPLPDPPIQLPSSSQKRNASLAPVQTPSESTPPPSTPLVVAVSPSCSLVAMNLDNSRPEPQSPFSSPSTTYNILVEKRKESEERAMLKLRSPLSTRRSPSMSLGPSEVGNSGNTAIITPPSASAHMPTAQTRASIETLLPRDLSPIPHAGKGKGKAIYVDDDADIVLGEKRSVFKGSNIRNEESEEGVSLKFKSPISGRRSQSRILNPSDEGIGTGAADAAITTPLSKAVAPISTRMSTQTQTSIATLLTRDLSPMSDAEMGKGKAKESDKMSTSDNFLGKRYISLGDDADIVRVKKRKVLEGSTVTERGLSLEETGLAAKGKDNSKKEEKDGSEVLKTKSGQTGADAKKPSLLNLKTGKKGESVAITRVKKRKFRPDFVVDGEEEGEKQYDDGLDQEKPLKHARQRVSERQTKIAPLKEGRRLTRELSGSSLVAGTSTKVTKPRSSTSVKKGPPSKGRLSFRKSEVEWPTVTKGDRSEDLVGCDNCKAWYHYGCVGLVAGDTRLRCGKKYFCPPCEVGTTIKRLNTDKDCWRPNCIIPAGYIVEKIIGRFKKFVGGQGIQFRYLLQWKGYDLSESSWEPEESMFDPPFMIEKFRTDALEEGIDIDKDETGLILLRAAKDPSVPKAR